MAALLYILSVNLDSIGVGISYGLRRIHITCRASVIIAVMSTICFALSFYLGTALNTIINPVWGKLLAASVLFLLGIWIILPAKDGNQKNRERILKVRSLGITILILQDPPLCDFDSSKQIDAREALALAFALSLDALGVGFGAGLAGSIAWYLPIAIGVSQFIFLALGRFLGARLSSVKIPHKVWTLTSGAILILLAILHII